MRRRPSRPRKPKGNGASQLHQDDRARRDAAFAERERALVPKGHEREKESDAGTCDEPQPCAASVTGRSLAADWIAAIWSSAPGPFSISGRSNRPFWGAQRSLDGVYRARPR